MTDITIVTAFFDIGRGNWTQSMEKRGGPLPHYLQRTNDTYIDRFRHLLTLENDLIVFTSPDVAPTLREMGKDKANFSVEEIDFTNEFTERRAQIRAVMDDPNFPNRINPSQVRNPEYWCEDYVLVMSLKPFFVQSAIEKGLAKSDTVAWIDFGYCRDAGTLAGKTKWDYDFTPNRIHLWNCQDITDAEAGPTILHAVANNSVVFFGAQIVASRDYWKPLLEGSQRSLDELISKGLVDDDQGLWLMCYFGNPAVFELHPLDYSDPFVVFRDYNNA